LSFFIKLRIPASVSSGEYKGKIYLKAGAEELRDIEFHLRVYDFEIPASSSLRTAFELYPWELSKNNYKDNLKAYLNNMAEHRITAVNAAMPVVKKAGDDLIIDTAEMDAVLEYSLNKLHMNSVYMPYSLFGVQNRPRPFLEEKPVSREWKTLMGKYLAYMVDHFKNKGWHDKLIYFIWDEPHENKSVKELISEGADLVEEIDEDAIIYVSHPNSFFTPKYNAKALSAEFALLPERIKERSYGGTWITLDGVCMGWIGDDLVKPRLMPWIAWAYEFDGMELWSINAWSKQRTKDENFTFRQSPFEYKDFPVAAHNFDGVLVYPGNDGLPLNSLRWESLADGMEDYEYLNLLEKKTKNKKDAESADMKKATALLDEIREAVFNRNDEPATLQTLLAFRARLAELNERIPSPSPSP